MLSSEVFAMSTSDEMGNYLTELEALIREDKLLKRRRKWWKSAVKNMIEIRRFHKRNMKHM